MKSQIKDILIGIFAVIGFTAIVMGFNNPQEPQQVTYGTPESHVWEMHMSSSQGATQVFSINKQTGEVRRYSTYSNSPLYKDNDFEEYRVAVETKPEPK